MQPAFTLFWMVTGLALSIGTVMTIVGLVRAPDGYEGEDGFQYSYDDKSSAEAHDDHVGHTTHPWMA